MHDKTFSILFTVHLVLVIFLAFRYGGLASVIGTSPSLRDSQVLGSKPVIATPTPSITPSQSKPHSATLIPKQDIHVDFQNAIYIATSSTFYSASLTFLTVVVMVILNRSFIQSSLCFAIVFCFAWGAVGAALSPYSSIPIFGMIAVVLTTAYTVVVWDRIPLAAVNLNTALTGIRASMDLILFSYFMMSISIVWTIVWTFASLGLYDFIVNYSIPPRGFGTFQDISLGTCMILSYIWTMNVILVSFSNQSSVESF
jgi:hypothetical protein